MKGKASFALGPDWYLSGELQSSQMPARIFGHFQLCWLLKAKSTKFQSPPLRWRRRETTPVMSLSLPQHIQEQNKAFCSYSTANPNPFAS